MCWAITEFYAQSRTAHFAAETYRLPILDKITSGSVDRLLYLASVPRQPLYLAKKRARERPKRDAELLLLLL